MSIRLFIRILSKKECSVRYESILTGKNFDLDKYFKHYGSSGIRPFACRAISLPLSYQSDDFTLMAMWHTSDWSTFSVWMVLIFFLGFKSLNSPSPHLKNCDNDKFRKCGIITPVVSAEWATDHDETMNIRQCFLRVFALPLSYQFILDK